MQKLATETMPLLAHDSAGAAGNAVVLYRDALYRLGVDCRDIRDVNELRALFAAAKLKPTRRPAFDSSSDFSKKFPNAARELRVL